MTYIAEYLRPREQFRVRYAMLEKLDCNSRITEVTTRCGFRLLVNRAAVAEVAYLGQGTFECINLGPGGAVRRYDSLGVVREVAYRIARINAV